MPAVPQTQLRNRIRAYFMVNPGIHRTADIATALGCPEGTTRSRWTIAVGNEMARMLKQGLIDKVERGKYQANEHTTDFRFKAAKPKKAPAPAFTPPPRRSEP